MAIYLLSNNHCEPVKCIVHVGSARKQAIDVCEYLGEVRVERYHDKVSSATVVLRAPRAGNAASAREFFSPVEPILIQAIFGSRTEEVLRGYITDIRVENRRKTAAAQLVIRCQDESFPLARTPVHRRWAGEDMTTDRVIVATILEKYGFSLDPASGQGLSIETLYQAATDRDFLLERAAVNAYELLFQQGRVYFGPLRSHLVPLPSIEVHSGSGSPCRRFLFRSGSYRWGNRRYDSAQGDLNGSCYGHILQVGRPVRVTGLVGACGGKYYVERVIHSFARNSYYQRFRLIRKALGSPRRSVVTANLPHLPGLLYEVL
jgi:hypothetical protein